MNVIVVQHHSNGRSDSFAACSSHVAVIPRVRTAVLEHNSSSCVAIELPLLFMSTYLFFALLSQPCPTTALLLWRTFSGEPEHKPDKMSVAV